MEIQAISLAFTTNCQLKTTKFISNFLNKRLVQKPEKIAGLCSNKVSISRKKKAEKMPKNYFQTWLKVFRLSLVAWRVG